MSETIKQIKQTIDEARGLKIVNWNTETIEFLLSEIDRQHDEFYNEVRFSQQEKEMSSHRHALYAGELREQIESLKAITELAVNELKQIVGRSSTSDYETTVYLAKSTLSEIERLTNG